jgi:signal transduction histidine kinase
MLNQVYRILVVDDETDLFSLFKKHFRQSIKQGQFIFEFADNGRKALDILSKGELFHILFTDIKMPVMDGLTLLSHIKALKLGMKIVVVSAYDDVINIRTAMNRDAFDFLVKPIDLEDLTLTMDKTIREYDVYRKGLEAAKKLATAIKEKEEAVHKERQRLSRDLHDDIGSTLSSINIISNMALRNEVLAKDDKLKASIEKINDRSQHLLDNMSDIVWCINPDNDTMEEVLTRMRQYATTVLEAKKIEYDISFPNENIGFNMMLDIKNNLYLIFKEAVNNLAKYSEASMVRLSIAIDQNNILLRIDDNGKGFDINKVEHHGGLVNMKHRAFESKGSFQITSSPGNGASVEVCIPFC